MKSFLFDGVVIGWVAMLMLCFAERQYFIQPTQLSWEEARKHCQLCFTELISLTPENVQNAVQNLSSVHWIGLRRNKDPAVSRMSWSHWANGDPLIFQNWSPGQPVLESFFSSCPCLSSSSSLSCSSDASKAEVSSCARTDYVTDSCVAVLSFGLWVEDNCAEMHPFICYEDHFIGLLSVTHRTAQSATLQWSNAPGPISGYRVEVKGDINWVDNQTEVRHHLTNLTAGQLYSVQVFPIKCGRDLNPQNISFYTIPNKVNNLTVANVTETSLYLSWSKPEGNLDFYLVRAAGDELQMKTEGRRFDGLTPGSCYTFTVFTGVSDQSTRSEESVIAVFTKPEKVSKLTASENTNDSLLLTWEAPEGHFTGFLVLALNDSNDVLYEDLLSQTLREVRVTDLQTGTRITLVVTVQTNHTLLGDSVTIVNYTAPGPITELDVVTGFSHLSATWKLPKGKYSFFTVKLLLDGNILETKEELVDPHVEFDGLRTAANYTVVVQSVSGHLVGPTGTRSKFTLPSPPTDAKATAADQSSLTFEWKAPENIHGATYGVTISSTFWGHSWSAIVSEQTNYTFTNLSSGSRYMFGVHTVGDGLNSTSANCSQYTVMEERELSLSMLCSSLEPLLCDNATVRETVFSQLYAHIYSVFRDDILWNLEKQETLFMGG